MALIRSLFSIHFVELVLRAVLNPKTKGNILAPLLGNPAFPGLTTPAISVATR